MSDHKRLIVFFIPPIEAINGGILSIFSLCEISRKFIDIHHSEVVLSTYPGSKSYKKNKMFNNNENIYSFDEIVKWGKPISLLIHVPEYASMDIFKNLKIYNNYLEAIPDFRVNILNQNIQLMQSPVDTSRWLTLTLKVTQTTAHDKYSTQENSNLYNIPLHHFSTFIDKDQYVHTPIDKKKDIIVLSPDKSPNKGSIVRKLKTELPNYKLVTVNDMTYDSYKQLVSDAKYVVSFGEGFDGYYVEGFLSGAITFAVYNDDFFPSKEFLNFSNVYPDYKTMNNNLAHDITNLKNSAHDKIVRDNTEVINDLYSFDKYSKNVSNFYMSKYTFEPEDGSAEKLIAVIMNDFDTYTYDTNIKLGRLKRHLSQKDQTIENQNKLISDLVGSKSWKMTEPLRRLATKVKKFKGK